MALLPLLWSQEQVSIMWCLGCELMSTAAVALLSMALVWTKMAKASDWRAAQPKPQCLQLVPGWHLSQGWSQSFPEAAIPLQGQVLGAPQGWICLSSAILAWMVSSSLLQLLFGPSKSCTSLLG